MSRRSLPGPGRVSVRGELPLLELPGGDGVGVQALRRNRAREAPSHRGRRPDDRGHLRRESHAVRPVWIAPLLGRTQRRVRACRAWIARRRAEHPADRAHLRRVQSALVRDHGRTAAERGVLVNEREILVRTGDGAMTGFAVHPDREGPFPVALVYMDAPGYRETLKDNARRFSADGYFCVVPDLFYRAGEKLTMDEYGREAIFELVRGLTPEKIEADTEAALGAVADDPAASAGAKVCVGYCMGAKFALHIAAARGDVAAAAGI